MSKELKPSSIGKNGRSDKVDALINSIHKVHRVVNKLNSLKSKVNNYPDGNKEGATEELSSLVDVLNRGPVILDDYISECGNIINSIDEDLFAGIEKHDYPASN